MAKVDALSVLKSLDKDELARQIADAKKRVDDATSELRALQSMEKLRAIRAGELKRKPVERRGKKKDDKTAEKPLTLKERVVEYLRLNGGSKPATIAHSLGVDPAEVARLMDREDSTFRKTTVSGVVAFTLY